jgi:hypothetical protein
MRFNEKKKRISKKDKTSFSVKVLDSRFNEKKRELVKRTLYSKTVFFSILTKPYSKIDLKIPIRNI